MMDNTKPKRKLKYKTKRQLVGLAFCSVWIVGFLLFTFYPIVQTFIYSLNDVRIGADGTINLEYKGFRNYYEALVVDTEFTWILVEYLMQMIVEVPVIIVISLLLSLLLNKKIRGTTVFRTIFFLPVIITSGPVIKLLIDLEIAALPGVYNVLDISSLEASVPSFLLQPLTYVIDSFIMIMWYSGIQILIFLAALQKMDKNVYEAASIDGASGWEKFWKITMPALNPMIILNFVFTIVTQSLFALNPIILKIRADMNALGYGYGYASSEAWIYFVTLLFMLALCVLIVRKREKKYKVEVYKSKAVFGGR